MRQPVGAQAARAAKHSPLRLQAGWHGPDPATASNNESRLSIGNASAQGFQVPQPGEGPVHTLGYYGTLPGRYRYYQARYAVPVPCGWNTTNAIGVLWIP